MSTPPSDRDLEALLDYLKRSRGFDFTGYKRPSLVRRIRKRMQEVGVEHYDDYQDFLEVHPDEFGALFNTILINVTDFFRDPPVWDAIRNDVLPRILAHKPTDGPIRVWCAGCASGEETYALAMVLAEALGAEQFRERVKIYATDVDEEALARARQATYSARAVTGVPPDLLERYFERIAQQFVFNKELRRSIIFGRHDLIHDAPISRIDLLLCRNVLMYFNVETQRLVLARFHFALNDAGVLVLGKAEMLSLAGDGFVPADLKRRIFAKIPRSNLRNHVLLASPADPHTNNGAVVNRAGLLEAAFDDGRVAEVVIDRDGVLVLANQRARTLFGLHARDVGRLFQDLDLSYRPVELRSRIEQAAGERRAVAVSQVEWAVGRGELAYLDVQVQPLLDASGLLLGSSITFTDATRFRRLQDELQAATQELETAMEELQSTNEELETTNEELQSTIEELETTNEELQATNEELETMNEELQATNEELQTTNDELSRRGDELNDVNTYLQAVLASWRGAVVVLNQALQVHLWNGHVEDLWGLRSDEVLGQHFLSLDIGLPVDQLHGPIRACLTGEAESVETILPAVNRRGRSLRCRVTCLPLKGSDSTLRGAILLMEPLGDAERQG